MFSRLNRLGNVGITNLGLNGFGINNINKNFKAKRFYWIDNNDGIYSVGVNREIIDLYEKVNDVRINKNIYIKRGEELCYIETPYFIDTINAPFDCKVINKNNKIKKMINIDPENKKKSWILKIEPIILNKQYVYQLPHFVEYYFDYNRNTQPIPVFAIFHI